MSGLIPPEIDRRFASMMCIRLDRFCNDEVFKESAPQRMGEKLVFVPYAQQVRSDAGVVKIQLGTLDYLYIYD
jgi:hypothetical protein